MAGDISIKAPPQSLKAWIQAFRPFSYTASVIPVLLGAALAVHLQQKSNWPLFPLILLASVLLQAGTNLVSEYFDFKKGVDREETFGSSRVLVDQLLLPKQVLFAGLVCFAVSVGIGMVFIVLLGWKILLLGAIGLLGGFFYTAVPVGYKYLGLGDLLVFCLMGPLMVIGSFYVLTYSYHHHVLVISLPVGFLVAGILSGNNLRDMAHDTQANINTTATVLGPRLARLEYSALTAGAFLSTLVMIGFGVLPLWSLMILPAILPAVKNIKAALNSTMDKPEDIAALDVQTAQLHTLLGLLLIASLVLERVL